jgi:hypothetical protein
MSLNFSQFVFGSQIFGDQIKVDDMGWAFGTKGREEKCIWGFSRKEPRGRPTSDGTLRLKSSAHPRADHEGSEGE